MGNIRLYGSTSGYTELAPPAVAPDGVLSLPSGTGTIAKTTDQGLVHINTTTFSAVASVSVNNCFTSTYDNYTIIGSVTGTVGTPITARMRLSGTSANTNYADQYVHVTNTTYNQGRRTAQTTAYLAQLFNGVVSGFDATLISPALATPTQWESQVIGGGTDLGFLTYNGVHTTATAYDGIEFLAASGTMTGTIRIYGYKNS